jgi:hypothetical protein
MTPIESIYEIRSDVLYLQRYLYEKKPVVYHRAYERYEKLVNRFFRENVNFVEPEKRIICIDDVDYFLRLLEETVELYQMN